jgi:two-component system, NarL family, response regulator LiaR
MNKIRVLITDDHRVVREGIASLMEEEEDIEVIGQAADGMEAVELMRIHHPDVILLDLVMPRMDGVTAIQEIIREYPQARILVLTSFAEDDKVYAAIQSGALGYLLKDSSAQELLEAIRRVYKGEAFLPPIIARKLVRGISQPKEVPPVTSLTDRELSVLSLLAQGLSNKEIGEKLFISERTVYGHIGNILKKLGLSNRTQAALYAVRGGLAQTDNHSSD